MSMDSGFAEKSSENRKRKGSIKAIKVCTISASIYILTFKVRTAGSCLV